ncbi:hypothetical protein HD806DRAFT_309685 [Xylariaceae sp. AK1471]|nr:hypothetical protein HD806DRAFT_309685 [Xylariaceae sp. AK1471]
MTTVDNSGPNVDYQRPRTRQRIHKEPPDLAVPNINDDAAERKRVLNVLAQRRYRERKRQEKSRGTAKTATSTPKYSTRDTGSSSPASQNASVSEAPIPDNEASSRACSDSLSAPASASTSLTFTSDVCPQTIWPVAATIAGLLPGREEPRSNTDDFNLSAMQIEASAIEVEATAHEFLGTMNPSTLPGVSPSGSSSQSDNYESEDLSFPDSYYLPVNELTLLRGLMRIAIRLRCNTTTIWDLEANSPFNDGTHTALTTQQLPPVWRPTLSQLSMPHHPIIDLLPWPNVRDRILMLMSLPDEARPPVVAGPLAVVQLAYDLEDAAEGIRIWSDNPYEPTSWEIGQVLFERWWFIFDRQVIDQSNYWRKLRGAATLTIKSSQ